MSYATVESVQNGLQTPLTEQQIQTCTHLLEEAAIYIDSLKSSASAEVKGVVSCRMVRRSLGSANDVPLGATQGSMSALGYSQSWTIGASGSVGELYISKAEKQMLGVGNKIGSKSPIEEVSNEGNHG